MTPERALKRKRNRYNNRVKLIATLALMCAIIVFCGFLGISGLTRGSKDLEDLTHVEGVIENYRIIKHEAGGKNRIRYEDVLVLQVQGCNDEVGLAEHNKAHNALLSLLQQKKLLIADIYYDKKGERIEQNVTLHIFNLSVNGKKYISIETTNRTDFLGGLLFSSIAIFVLILTIRGAKKFIKFNPIVYE